MLNNIPPSIALNTNLESVALFSGQRTPIPPTQIPILDKFAKPASEIDATIANLGSKLPINVPSVSNAINSFNAHF